MLSTVIVYCIASERILWNVVEIVGWTELLQHGVWCSSLMNMVTSLGSHKREFLQQLSDCQFLMTGPVPGDGSLTLRPSASRIDPDLQTMGFELTKSISIFPMFSPTNLLLQSLLWHSQDFSLFHSAHTSSGPHPASCQICTGGKAARTWSWRLTSYLVPRSRMVEQYLHSRYIFMEC
jgi:hypothetical protein